MSKKEIAALLSFANERKAIVRIPEKRNRESELFERQRSRKIKRHMRRELAGNDRKHTTTTRAGFSVLQVVIAFRLRGGATEPEHPQKHCSTSNVHTRYFC